MAANAEVILKAAAANQVRGLRNSKLSEVCYASDFSLLFTSGRGFMYLCKTSAQPCESGGESSWQFVVNITPASMAETV